MVVHQAEEEWLVERAQRGDLDAFNSLIYSYQTPVYNLCLRMLGNREAAEDATQEAFLLSFRGIGRFQGGNLRAWIYRIATNACYDELRRRSRRPSASLDALSEDEERPFTPADDDPSPEDEALTAELRREIERGLLTLPEEQRAAVILCDVHGLTYEEIAEVMRTSLGTVKSRVSRGRARMRAFMRNSREPLPPSERQEE